mmetsp:Transcript_10377/g.38488  ORF Transcript_10377/g.38488 Transcript_10377/m.38488 type:complete len:233 (+) Transcript_10377:4568-5266(+)
MSATSTITQQLKNSLNSLTLSLKKPQTTATAARAGTTTNTKLPSFYTKLNHYFPDAEMKKPEHFVSLLNEKPSLYLKEESEEHVLMYSNHDDFLCIDYVWVSEKSRGLGIGKKLLNNLKNRGKPIYLEVEQPTHDDPDSLKRLKFYSREGFRHANQISYVRKASLTGERIEMEILYWAPEELPQQNIVHHMREFYREIHRHRCMEFYGRELDAPAKVLTLEQQEKDDMLSDL